MARSIVTVTRSLTAFVAVAVFTATVAFAAADDDRLERLAPQDRELAEWLNAFLDRMDEKYFGRVGEINGELVLEDRSFSTHPVFSTEWSNHEVRATRGEVMEKAGRVYSMGKKQRAERGGREIVWSRFYSLDMHPKTPLVGMLHAAIVMQFFGDGTSLTGGWIGIMPGTRIDEDLAPLNQLTEDYFAAADVDITIHRERLCQGHPDVVFEFRRNPACVGASFYAPPVYPGDTEKSIKFIANFYDLFVDSYLDTVEKRSDDPYTEADILAQDKMRKSWFMDQVFSDPYSSAQIPFEVHTFWNAAPVIKF
jgi:coproporphyrinogen III oxidase